MRMKVRILRMGGNAMCSSLSYLGYLGLLGYLSLLSPPWLEVGGLRLEAKHTIC